MHGDAASAIILRRRTQWEAVMAVAVVAILAGCFVAIRRLWVSRRLAAVLPAVLAAALLLWLTWLAVMVFGTGPAMR